jgi:hypothetical protein
VHGDIGKIYYAVPRASTAKNCLDLLVEFWGMYALYVRLHPADMYVPRRAGRKILPALTRFVTLVRNAAEKFVSGF